MGVGAFRKVVRANYKNNIIIIKEIINEVEILFYFILILFIYFSEFCLTCPGLNNLG
jgi:hypothetical protein